MNRVAIVISPNWRDYGQKYLPDCLASVARLDLTDVEAKVFLIDNESTDQSFEFIVGTGHALSVPWEIIRNSDNVGFAKGNNAAMKIALEQGFNYLALFNIDTELDKNCVQEMLAAIKGDDQIAAVQARLMLFDDQEKINSLGNTTHFLGFGYCEAYGRQLPTTNYQLPTKQICYPSGAAVMFRASALKKAGLFDEEFWMYNEDQDLGWRLALAGYQSVLVFNAIVYHKYHYKAAAETYYLLDRNRLLSILKNYRLGSLLVILPALIIMEIGQWYFAITNHWFKAKLKVYGYFLRPSTWQYLTKARRASQQLRTVSDREIIKLFSGKIVYPEINSKALGVANIMFNIYWQIVKRIIFW